MNNIFLVIVMLELFLMGSGRFIEIGPLTLRMIFFSIATFYAVILLVYKNRIDRQIFFLLNIFLVVHSLAFLIGSLNNAQMHLMLNDIKPLLFFFMLIYFCMFIRDMEGVNLTIKTIKAAALILALPYLIFLLLLHLEIIHLDADFIAMLENHKGKDIRFQQHMGVFYNGFLYLCVGFLFFVFEKGKINKLISALIFTAIVFTFSRGFVLSTGLVLLIYVTGRFIRSKLKVKYLAFLIVSCCVALLAGQKYIRTVGNKYISDITRIITFKQVVEAVTPISLFLGHGLGVGTAERPVHMEVSYLEIFHKQGILGLLFWFMLFVVIVREYSKACRNGARNMALPFMLSSLLIFILTATNNYMNNPLGMSMLLISIAALNVLARNDYLVLIEESKTNERMSDMQITD
jgi:hypothetical protein